MEIQMVYTIQQNKYIACESHIKTILQLVPLQQKKNPNRIWMHTYRLASAILPIDA